MKMETHQFPLGYLGHAKNIDFLNLKAKFKLLFKSETKTIKKKLRIQIVLDPDKIQKLHLRCTLSRICLSEKPQLNCSLKFT